MQKGIVARFRAFQGISTGRCIPGRHKLIFCIFFCIIIFLCIGARWIGFLCSFCALSGPFCGFLENFFCFVSFRFGSRRIGAGDSGIHYSDLIWNVENFANIFWNILAGAIWDISPKSEIVLRANYNSLGIKCYMKYPITDKCNYLTFQHFFMIHNMTFQHIPS